MPSEVTSNSTTQPPSVPACDTHAYTPIIVFILFHAANHTTFVEDLTGEDQSRHKTSKST